MQEATQKLAGMDLEVQDLRRAAVRESTLEAERIRDMTQAEVEKIAQAARAEIKAAERAAQQELRAAVAHLATDRAADDGARANDRWRLTRPCSTRSSANCERSAS